MMKTILSLMSLVVMIIFMTSCTNSEEGDGGKTLTEKAEAIGQQRAEAIKTPLDQAKRARELTEQHNKILQDAAKQ